MQLAGIHHLTAVTADARANHAFYTQTLGVRLVKKTVNQDDTSAYHLFYADGRGTPGTDLTFFDWPADRERRGTRSIVRTGLRVAGAESLRYWAERLGQSAGQTVERGGHMVLDVEDPEGQRLSLVADDGRLAAHPWAKSPVPAEHQVRGLGPITVSVPELKATEAVLTQVMEMRRVREYSGRASDGSDVTTTVHVFEMGAGGSAAELHVAVEPGLRAARQGAGGVHHVADRGWVEAALARRSTQ
jgi:glyoxalase family protein